MKILIIACMIIVGTIFLGKWINPKKVEVPNTNATDSGVGRGGPFDGLGFGISTDFVLPLSTTIVPGPDDTDSDLLIKRKLTIMPTITFSDIDDTDSDLLVLRKFEPTIPIVMFDELYGICNNVSDKLVIGTGDDRVKIIINMENISAEEYQGVILLMRVLTDTFGQQEVK